MSPTPSGSRLADNLSLLRGLIDEWWDAENERPRSVAFSRKVFSANIHRSTESVRWFLKLRRTTRIVSFGVKSAHDLGYDCRDELDPNQPDNPDHVHVYNPNPESQRKIRTQALVFQCTRLESYDEILATHLAAVTPPPGPS
jgi:hypothetical protein